MTARLWWAGGAVAAVAYALGLGLDVMEADAAMYASIARDMADGGPWLELVDRGEPFLNKPPLLFWLSALSFKLLGVSNATYRLPSLLIFALGILSTAKLAERYAGKRAGLLTALVFVSCQGAFLMIQDVRTDTMLTGLVAFSLWRAAVFLDDPTWRSAAALGLGLGGALLAKGVIGLMVPALGAGAHVVARREWARFAWGKAVLALTVATVLLVPMCIGLYRQHGASGLYFHFWTQGFGRVFSENIWGDEHGVLFFIPQMFWIFFPWILFLGAALWDRLRVLRRQGWRLHDRQEALTTGAFVLGFVGLSLSRSKLPHYVYVTLPAAAVITGTWLDRWLSGEPNPRSRALLERAQALLVIAMPVSVIFITWWAFPGGSTWVWVIAALVAAVACVQAARHYRKPGRLLLASALALVSANLLVNGRFMPRLLDFQSANAAGRLVAEQDPGGSDLIAYRTAGRALDFYARRGVQRLNEPVGVGQVLERARQSSRQVWIFTSLAGREELRASYPGVETIMIFEDFHVSRVTLEFLDRGSRSTVVRERFLLRLDWSSGREGPEGEDARPGPTS